MTASMTGYGRGDGDGPAGHVTAEIRSVNHRFCEIVLRLPRSLHALEDKIRRRVQERVARGRLEVSISLGRGSAASGSNGAKAAPAQAVHVDTELALAYYNHLKELGEKLGVGGNITLDMISRLPEVLVLMEPEVDPDEMWPAVEHAVDGALAALLAMRQREGAALAADLLGRVEALRAVQAELAARTHDLPKLYLERLQRRLVELLPPGSAGAANLDPGRLEAEAALLVDRTDVSEELLRLTSHLDQFAATLQGGEPAGRKLDFLVQELNREVNTIGSKASDLDVTRLVLAAKAEIEKMREQVQNVE